MTPRAVGNTRRTAIDTKKKRNSGKSGGSAVAGAPDATPAFEHRPIEDARMLRVVSRIARCDGVASRSNSSRTGVETSPCGRPLTRTIRDSPTAFVAVGTREASRVRRSLLQRGGQHGAARRRATGPCAPAPLRPQKLRSGRPRDPGRARAPGAFRRSYRVTQGRWW